MKTVTIPAIVLAAAASLTSLAATATEPPKVTDPQAEKAGASAVTPHSHLQEKTGIAPQKKSAKAKPGEAKTLAPPASKGTLKADKDKSKHFHPRDGK